MRPWLRAAPECRAVVEIVQTLFGARLEDIEGRGRSPHIVRARAVFWVVLRERYGWSFPDCGYVLNRDHTTVISCIKALRQRLDRDPELRDLVEALTVVAPTTVRAVRLRVAAEGSAA